MSRDERIVIRIGGDMSGQFVLGDNNVTTNSVSALSGADRKLLTTLFDEIGGQLDQQLDDHPHDLADPARDSSRICRPRCSRHSRMSR